MISFSSKHDSTLSVFSRCIDSDCTSKLLYFDIALNDISYGLVFAIFGADNILGEISKQGGKELVTVITTLCQKI